MEAGGLGKRREGVMKCHSNNALIILKAVCTFRIQKKKKRNLLGQKWNMIAEPKSISNLHVRIV